MPQKESGHELHHLGNLGLGVHWVLCDAVWYCALLSSLGLARVRSQVQRLVQDGLEALERLEDFHLAVQFLVGHTQGVRHRGMNPAVLPSAADTGSDTEGVIEPKFACFQRRHLGPSVAAS